MNLNPQNHPFQPEGGFSRHNRTAGGMSSVDVRPDNPCEHCERDRSEHRTELVEVEIKASAPTPNDHGGRAMIVANRSLS